MSKQFFVLNIMFIIADTIISALGILAFAWGAWFFGKWWLLLFVIIPMIAFNAHSLVIDSDIERAKENNE